MQNLLCKHAIAIGKHTFKENERYKGEKINEHWWCIDAIGVKTNDMENNFTIIDGNEKEMEEIVTT